MNVLPVPFVSQIAPGALEHNNDCGAATTLMVLKAYGVGDVTVDKIYNEIQPAGDTALMFGGMQRVLLARKIASEYNSYVRLGNAYEVLSGNRPAIALIHYGALVDAHLTERVTFRGAHFVVMIGLDIKNVYIHDPYSVTKGNCLEVPINIFKQAWSQCSLDNNNINSYIIMTPPIGDLTPPPPPIPPVPVGVKYVFGTNPTNGAAVQAVNVREGPGTSFKILRILAKSTTPVIYISEISLGYGRLSDKSGWVYIAYFNKA